MDGCKLLVYAQKITIQPYFGVKLGDYFFSLFYGDPVCKIKKNEKNEMLKFFY